MVVYSAEFFENEIVRVRMDKKLAVFYNISLYSTRVGS